MAIRSLVFLWRRLELRAALADADSPIHFNARVVRDLLAWTTRAQDWLFVASTLFGLQAVAIAAMPAGPWWATLASFLTLASEIIGRYGFFAAGGSKRMPGGIAV